MKKKVWREFRVLQSNYKVYKIKDLAEKNGYIGLCDSLLKEIVIDSNLTKDQFTLTLLHELRHAVTHESGLNQILDPQVAELDAEIFANFVFSIRNILNPH